MNYSEYFQKFYGGRSEGAIIGYKSKEKIPDFLFSISFGEAGYTMAELSGSSFAMSRTTWTFHLELRKAIWYTVNAFPHGRIGQR